MATRPPPPGRRRRRGAERPRDAVELLWATVLRRFRDRVHETDPENRPDPRPDREDPR